jgi:hypothetical protein
MGELRANYGRITGKLWANDGRKMGDYEVMGVRMGERLAYNYKPGGRICLRPEIIAPQ